MCKFCLLTSMELIPIPNFSLLYLHSNDMNSLNSLILKKKKLQLGNSIVTDVHFGEQFALNLEHQQLNFVISMGIVKGLTKGKKYFFNNFHFQFTGQAGDLIKGLTDICRECEVEMFVVNSL